MNKKEGYISDFPKKKRSEEGEGETTPESGYYGEIKAGTEKAGFSPSVGKKGGAGKYLKQFIEMIRQQEQDKKEDPNK